MKRSIRGKIVLGIVVAVLLAPAAGAAENSDRVQELQRQVDALEKQVEQLKEDKDQNKYLVEDVEEIFDRLNEVETKSFVDKVSIGAELRTRFDWFKYTDNGTYSLGPLPANQQYVTAAVGGSTMYTENPYYDPLALTSRAVTVNGQPYYYNYTNGREHVRALPSTRFRLNLKADITDNLIFRGRLTMFKNWGDNDINTYTDATASTTRRDTNLKVERAYIDYFFGPEKLPMALTFGRMPFAEGLPTDLREDTPRKSTYPALCYDIEGDGLALSIGLSDIIGLPRSGIKFVYSGFYEDHDTNMYRDSGFDVAPVYIMQFETGLPFEGLEDTILIFNYINNYWKARDLSFVGLINMYDPDRIATSKRYTGYIESKNIFDSGLDLFAGYTSVRVYGRGLAYYVFPLTGALVPSGYGTSDSYSNVRSCAWQLGGRYTVPTDTLNNPKIGMEVFHSSKFWIPTQPSSEDTLNKMENRGTSYDFYYIQPVNQYMSLRFGYTRVRQQYSNGTSLNVYLGTAVPSESHRVIRNTYCLVDVRF